MGDINTDPASGKVTGKTISPKEEYKTECEEKQQKTKTAIKEILTPGAKKKNFTMAIGGLVGGKSDLKPAFSCKSYYSDTSERGNKLLTGLEPGNRDNIPLCGSDSYPSNDQTAGHSEARIISELSLKGKLQGQTLLMNVNLVNRTGKVSKLPCIRCTKLICSTMKSCDTTIIICDHNNNGVDMSQACKDGKPANNRAELKRYLDIKEHNL